MISAQFEVDIGPDAPRSFAELSGDWNPLHTDADYAAGTRFGRPILHGAFLSGLVSRMAGMYLPGTACLLHTIRLRFLAPIRPPVEVLVSGTVVRDDGHEGRVEVSITDTVTGMHYGEGTYEFSRHERVADEARDGLHRSTHDHPAHLPESAPILVTGASGALGSAVLDALGSKALGLSRSNAGERVLPITDWQGFADPGMPDRISGIVHCGWPAPDNRRLLDLVRARDAVEHHVAAPLSQIVSLGQLLVERGTPGATLVLVGSTAASPGRHNYRMPLYTLAKSMVPVAARILGLELAPSDRRCVALTFDVIDGGMNEGLNPRARIMHTDRSPFGRIPTPSQAADQVCWVLENPGFLASGATLSLTGGAIP